LVSLLNNVSIFNMLHIEVNQIVIIAEKTIVLDNGSRRAINVVGGHSERLV
jgi:hypothetical protein